MPLKLFFINVIEEHIVGDIPEVICDSKCEKLAVWKTGKTSVCFINIMSFSLLGEEGGKTLE